MSLPALDLLTLAKRVDKRQNPCSDRAAAIINVPWSLSWKSSGDWFTIVRTIRGHLKSITGMALPSDSDTLYTVGNDGCMKLWNCHTGECTEEVDFGEKAGCVISDGPLVIVGLPNAVKILNGPRQQILRAEAGGQVYALASYSGLVFAGTQCGDIICWKDYDQPVPTQTIINAHKTPVSTLTIEGGRLYSGSLGRSIRVWSLDTFECLLTLFGHTSVVMSLLCWDNYLISGSLDKTIMIWGNSESGGMEVVYKHTLEHGVITLAGAADARGRPILLCSCIDKTVRMFELPSFADRGKIGSTQEIRCITPIGTKGLFLTGDATGYFRVWRCLPEVGSSAAD